VVFVSPEEVSHECQERLGYAFKNLSLLVQSLTHASVAESRTDSNERLEFLGDAVLGFVICEELYRRFPEYQEGDLTKIKSAVVARRTCADVANRLGLTDMLILGKGMSTRSRLPGSLAAAALESVIAAIYLDAQDIGVVREFILRNLGPHIDQAAASQNQRNYKSQLQQYAQKEHGTTPVYELLDEQGPDHSKCFEVCVQILGMRYPSAWGPNKKEAEQKAAQIALRELHLLQDPPAKGASPPRASGADL
jgi:ribonuclease-3